MSLLCPRCSRVLADSGESADAPLFCMFCGQKLRDEPVSSSDDTMGYEAPPALDSQHMVTRSVDEGAVADQRVAEQPPSSIGGYRLPKFIGAGGMGSVYEAEADTSDLILRKVADVCKRINDSGH